MRDLDVARILLGSGQSFHQKTAIICDPNEKKLSISRLRKFGHVLPIGLAGLASKLKSAPIRFAAMSNSLQFVEDVAPIASATEIEGDDFVELILKGKFSPAKYQAQIQQNRNISEPYCVRRGPALDAILSRPQDSPNRVIVSSDIGNGKSIFLDQLSNELVATGYRVIRISSRLNEVFSDLELVLSAGGLTAFLIDDVIRYRNVAEFIGARLNVRCLLICSTRSDAEDVQFKYLQSILGGATRHIDLNRLSNAELQNWDKALERWGFWEDRISLTPSERQVFLARECGGENRSIVVSLFRSSKLAIRIDQIVEFFLRTGAHSRAFAALLISSLCQQHVTWESLVSWLGLEEQALRKAISKSDIANLFSNGRDWNMLTSAQLAEYILHTKYVETDRDTLVEVFSTIVLSTAESATDNYLGFNFRENLKELMKFRFLTKLFGEGDSAQELINRVYTRLSRSSFIPTRLNIDTCPIAAAD